MSPLGTFIFSFRKSALNQALMPLQNLKHHELTEKSLALPWKFIGILGRVFLK